MCTLGPTHVFPVELKLVLHWAADYKACDVKGRVKLETRTAISVVPIVTSAASSDSDMRALCGWRAWKGLACHRGRGPHKVESGRH